MKYTAQYLVLKLRLLRSQGRPSRTCTTVRPCTVAITSRKRHVVLAQVRQPIRNIHTLSNLNGEEVTTQALCVVTSYGLVSMFQKSFVPTFSGLGCASGRKRFDFIQSTRSDLKTIHNLLQQRLENLKYRSKG